MKKYFSPWQLWLATAARLLLAGVWFWAGWPKFVHGDKTILSVRAFQILDDPFVVPFAYALPLIELALGAILLAGLFTRIASLLTAAMMIVFIGGIASAWARGLSIDCGCFGNTGKFVADPVPDYIRDLVRDGGYLAASLFLARWPRTIAAIDHFLQPPPGPVSA